MPRPMDQRFTSRPEYLSERLHFQISHLPERFTDPTAAEQDADVGFAAQQNGRRLRSRVKMTERSCSSKSAARCTRMITVDIWLDTLPFGPKPIDMPLKKIRRFYRRFGFEDQKTVCAEWLCGAILTPRSNAMLRRCGRVEVR